MSIFVLGGDGYLGWPLAMRMARTHPDQQVVLIDNQIRRKLVSAVGGNSITPVAAAGRRIEACHFTFKISNLTWLNLDLTSPEIDGVFREYRPHTIFHLGQIGSASYSMRGPEEAVHVLHNNETGNMRVLWAVRRHCPDAHIIKSGSMGQYAKCGLDFPEGYFWPECDGKKATAPVLFPRQSEDVYHVSKINDSNYLAMACRAFGLRVTDVMQALIFGVNTMETRAHEALLTRFDHDEYFGTVMNRFIAQAVSAHPITVFGTGWQRTGLMALEDAVSALAMIARDVPPRGTHRVINTVTEKDFCVRDLAKIVADEAAARGIHAEISYNFNPRNENEPHKMTYSIHNAYISRILMPSNLADVLDETMDTVLYYQSRIRSQVFQPGLTWATSI